MKLVIKHFLLALFAFICLLGLFALDGYAQTECPVDKVCLSREAAMKAIEDGDARKALEVEVKRLREAIEGTPETATTPAKKGYKDIINDLRVDFARVSGEYSGFKQGSVRVDAAFDTAIKNTKKKCMPLSLCF